MSDATVDKVRERVLGVYFEVETCYPTREFVQDEFRTVEHWMIALGERYWHADQALARAGQLRRSGRRTRVVQVTRAVADPGPA